MHVRSILFIITGPLTVSKSAGDTRYNLISFWFFFLFQYTHISCLQFSRGKIPELLHLPARITSSDLICHPSSAPEDGESPPSGALCSSRLVPRTGSLCPEVDRRLCSWWTKDGAYAHQGGGRAAIWALRQRTAIAAELGKVTAARMPPPGGSATHPGYIISG